MKTSLNIVLSCALVVTAFLWWADHRRQVAVAKADRDALEAQLTETNVDPSATVAETKAKVLQETLSQETAATEAQSRRAAELEQSLAQAKSNRGPDSAITAMLKDPKMKEMIKAQQEAYLGPMIDRNYGAFFKQLNLSPDQVSQLKDLLKQKLSAGTQVGMSIFDDNQDASKRADLVKQMKEQTDAINTQIQQLLGDNNYQAFQAYDKTTADRMSVGQFRDQLAGTDTALSPSQEQQLIAAMSNERASFKWNTDFPKPDPSNPDYAQMFSPERIDNYAKELDRLDQQMLARASSILSPDQMTRFESFLSAQSQMQVAGMRMASQMVGGQKTGNQ